MPRIVNSRNVEIVNTNDLRGVNLINARLTGVDLTGCRRLAGDYPIPGWRVRRSHETQAYTLQCVCPSCGRDQLFSMISCEHRFCTDCCSRYHYNCTNCSEHRRASDYPRCTACRTCNNCCECERCPECSALPHTGEDTCGLCSRHCECEGAHGSPLRASKKDKFNSPRLAGVEWEYNDEGETDIGAWCDRFGGTRHSDGSCGWEAVTPPMAGDHIRKCLKELGKIFDAEGTQIDNHCGIHVHVDARDLKWADIYRLLWVYAKVEPVLYILAGQQRLDNEYCQPCGPRYLSALSEIDRKGAILQVAFTDRYNNSNQGRTTQRGVPGKKSGGRYKGINLCPWLSGRSSMDEKTRNRREYIKVNGRKVRKTASDTTIEFRMHRNTDDAERVINWTELLIRLVDWVAKATDKEAHNLPKSALRALCVIAPDKRDWILSRVKQWRKVTTVLVTSATADDEETELHSNRLGRAPRRLKFNNQEFSIRKAA